MKKIIAVLLTIVLLLGLSACGETKDETEGSMTVTSDEQQSEKSGGFRNATWGMSMDEVKLLEDAEFIKEGEIEQESGVEQYLSYKGEIYGFDCQIYYCFVEGYGLCKAYYQFEVDEDTDKSYIEDYERIKRQLVEQYGEPNTVLDADGAKEMGIEADLFAFSVWRDGNTEINLGLTENGYVLFSLYYDDKEFKQSRETL